MDFVEKFEYLLFTMGKQADHKIFLFILGLLIDEMSLMNVIKRRLGRLVRDKETSHQMPERAGNWLHDEVSTLEATTKAGTFR